MVKKEKINKTEIKYVKISIPKLKKYTSEVFLCSQIDWQNSFSFLYWNKPWEYAWKYFAEKQTLKQGVRLTMSTSNSEKKYSISEVILSQLASKF